MRTTIAKFALVALLATGVTGCGMLGGGGDGGGDRQGQGQEEGQEEGQGSPSDGGGTDGTSGGGASDGGGATDDEGAAGGDAEAVTLSETVAEQSMEKDGSTLTFELKGVTANSASATAHGVLTNSGEEIIYPELHDGNLLPEGVPSAGSAYQLNTLTITDPSTGNLHTPAYTSDGHCLCSRLEGGLKPGESMPIFAQYAPLPDGTSAVVVTFGELGSFEGIPVTWS